VEGQPQHVPLNRIGVLELIHEHDAVARPHPLAGHRAVLRVLQGVAQLHQRVVVVDQTEPALAGLHLIAHALCRCPAHPRQAGRPLGPQVGRAVAADSPPAQRQQLLVAQLGRGGPGPSPLPKVEVVDDLADQVVDGLGEDRRAIRVGENPEPGEHL